MRPKHIDGEKFQISTRRNHHISINGIYTNATSKLTRHMHLLTSSFILTEIKSFTAGKRQPKKSLSAYPRVFFGLHIGTGARGRIFVGTAPMDSVPAT